MPWKVSDITHTFDVDEPDGDEVAHVTIHRLSEGDRVEVQRVITASEEPIAVALEQVRHEWIRRSVTTWTLPVPKGDVEALDPRVAEAILEQIQRFNPGVFPRSTSPEDRLRRADGLAEAVDQYLVGELDRDDLASLLAQYRGADEADPT